MALPRGLEASRKINPLANRLDSFVSRFFSWLYRLSAEVNGPIGRTDPGRSITEPSPRPPFGVPAHRDERAAPSRGAGLHSRPWRCARTRARSLVAGVDPNLPP